MSSKAEVAEGRTLVLDMVAAEADAACGTDGATPVALWIDFWAVT